MIIIEKKITSYDSLSFKKYLNEIDKYDVLTIDEEVELAIKAENGDERAFNKLVNCNLRFVVSVAKQYVNKRVKLEDLVNEGNLGLIEAAKRFDHTKGFKLISFAVWWIRQKIGRYLDDNSAYFRIPSGKVKTGQAVNEARLILTQQFRREPTSMEIIDFISEVYPNKYPKSSIEVVLRTQRTTVSSLDDEIGDDGLTLGETLDGGLESTEHLVEDGKLVAQVKKVLTILNEREKFVIINIYGLFGEEQLTMNQVGEIMGLTGSRVQQINGKALSKLKANSGIFQQIFS